MVFALARYRRFRIERAQWSGLFEQRRQQDRFGGAAARDPRAGAGAGFWFRGNLNFLAPKTISVAVGYRFPSLRYLQLSRRHSQRRRAIISPARGEIAGANP